MKKIVIGFFVLTASLFTCISCASTKVEDTAAAPVASVAREAAMAEEGAIDLSSWSSVDSWAVKFNEAEWAVTMNGGEFIQWPLAKEVAAGETVTVHLTGTNNGKSGFRSWLIDMNQKTNSNVLMDYAFENLPQGDFDVTYTLTATDTGAFLFIKGPVWGTMLEKLTFKSVAVTYE